MNTEELRQWFDNARDILEAGYLTNVEPWKQSGMSGPEERWICLRKAVAECIDKSGSFLDIGCANGYLLECCQKWNYSRDIIIEPYGIDISPKLIELAKNRLPQHADNFIVANAFYWIPSKQFDFVRTELVYVPAEYEKQYIEFLLDHYINPGGKLLIANYLEDHPHPEKTIISGSHPTNNILNRLTELGFKATDYKDVFDTVKNRKTRVAVLTQ
jgi:SAM-dependent methyltransferase